MSRQLLVALLFVVGSVWSQTHQLACTYSAVVYPGGEGTMTCNYIPGTPALTASTLFPLRFTVTVANAYIPLADPSAVGKTVITLAFNNGDTHKTFTFVAFANDQQVTFTVADATGQGILQIPTIPALTLTKRQVVIIAPQTYLRPGETSRPWTVRLTSDGTNSLAHSGLTGYGQTQATISLQMSSATSNGLSLNFIPPTLTFSHGQTTQQFQVQVQSTGSNLLGTSAIVTIGFNTGSTLYNFAGSNQTGVVCLPANGPGAAFVSNAISGYSIPSIPNGISVVAGLQTAPWYIFLDYLSPSPAAEFAPESSSVPVGGVDVVFTPDSVTNKWTFSQAGQSIMWQKYAVTPSLTGLGTSVIYFFNTAPNWPIIPTSVVTLFNGANAPAPAVSGFPSTLSFTVRSRDYSAMNPSGTVQIGDTFNVGVSLQQPLDAGVSVDINVDCPVLQFFYNGAWTSNAKITLSSGQTGNYLTAKAMYPGSQPLTFSMDSNSNGIYLFKRSNKVTTITVSRPQVLMGDLPPVQYTGLESQAIRIYLTAPVTSSLTAVPYHPHCVSNPSTITFTGGNQWARFTLRCLTTVANGGVSSPNNNLAVFLAGPDRYNFNLGAALNAYTTNPDLPPVDLGSATNTYNVARGARRATVAFYAEDGVLSSIPVLKDKAISIYTNRAPDSGLTVAFYSTNGATVTPSTVTLTPTQPNAIVHLKSSYPTSGQFGYVVTGADAHQYEPTSPVAYSSALRTVRVDRICTTAEIDAGIACGTANSTIFSSLAAIPLNPGDSFLTTFNFTTNVPTVNGLTITISNPNLVISPNPVTIPAGQQTAQFTVQTGVGGSHELYFSYSGAPDMYIHNSPTSGTSQNPVIVTQATAGKAGTAFPANSGIQTVVPALFIALLVLLLALF